MGLTDPTPEVEGRSPAGSAPVGNPVLVGGSDGTNVQNLAVDTNGTLRVNVVAGSAGGPSKVDDSAFTPGTDSVAPMGAMFDDTAPDTVDEGDVGIPRMSARREQYVQLRDAAGNERGANVNASNELQTSVGSIPGVLSAGNSSTTPLAGGATFTGTWEEITNYSGIVISVFADVASATDGLKFEWSSDGTNVDVDEVSGVTANVGRGFTQMPRSRYFRIRYVNGASAQTAFRLHTHYTKTTVSNLTRALDKAISGENMAQTVRAVITGEDASGAFFNARVRSPGFLEVLGHSIEDSIAQALLTGEAGHRFGYASTSSTAFTQVRATAYVEPPADGLEVVSSSASDASAGTGTRTLRVTFYRGTGDGPFTEDITLNGTTAVALADSAARFVEKMETLTVGSNGTNVGTITIRRSGAGATVGSIAVGDGITYWAHHYVPTGKKCFIRGISAGMTGNNGRYFLRYLSPLDSTSFYTPFSQNYRAQNNTNSLVHDMEVPLRVDGFRRIDLTVRSNSATANTIFAGFHYYEV